MKTWNCTLTMEIRNTDDINRSLEVTTDHSGMIKIGAGRNTQHPQLEIHPDDVESLVVLLRKTRDHKLPCDPPNSA